MLVKGAKVVERDCPPLPHSRPTLPSPLHSFLVQIPSPILPSPPSIPKPGYLILSEQVPCDNGLLYCRSLDLFDGGWSVSGSPW